MLKQQVGYEFVLEKNSRTIKLQNDIHFIRDPPTIFVFYQ